MPCRRSSSMRPAKASFPEEGVRVGGASRQAAPALVGRKSMTDVFSGARTPNSTRWLQLVVGIVCMAMIANLQYGWTLFVVPISTKFGWSQADIQVAFSIFILVETWLVPIEGWFVDRYGPAVVVAVGGILVAVAWTLNSIADSLP